MFAYAYTNQDGAKYAKQSADKTRIAGADKLTPGKHTIDFNFKYDAAQRTPLHYLPLRGDVRRLALTAVDGPREWRR